ncbi:MAG: iron-containing redox enzyme family protein [Azospirillaceae bacterium]|nr:iron-containing redox enzyme family protein [Azospirillaceae bacterium]
MSVAEVLPNNAAGLKIDQIEAIRQRVDARRMLRIPFFVELKDRALNQDEMRDFFLQYYSIVKTSYRMLAAGILNAQPEDTDTIGHLLRFLDTESGGETNHLTHYLRWAEHFGVSVEDLASSQPNQTSRAFDEILMGYFSTNDSFVHRAAQLGLEDCAQVLIEGLDQGFRKYDIPTRAYGYLMIHLLLENDEDGHSRWAIDSLAGAPDLAARRQELEAIYNRVYGAFENVFNGIHEEWQRRTRH